MGFIDLVFGDRGEKKRALLERARRYFRQGRVEKALEHAERAIKLDPDGAESRETLGRVYFRMGLLAWTDGSSADAIECFTDAQRLLNDPQILFYRGLVFRDTRQYLKAIEDFSRILRSEEIHVVSYTTYAAFCRGICYREKGEHRFAAKDFTTCILTAESSPLRHRFFAHRALCRAALGEVAEAQEDIRAAQTLAPRSAEVAHLASLLAGISVPAARPALPPGRSQSSAPPTRFVPPPSVAELDDLPPTRVLPSSPHAQTVFDLHTPLEDDLDELQEETTGRRLMPGLGTHVGRTPARGEGEEHIDPSDADWTLIPDSSPSIPNFGRPSRPVTPAQGPAFASAQRPSQADTASKPGRPEMPKPPAPSTSVETTVLVDATVPDLPAVQRSSTASDGSARAPVTDNARLEALKRKRDAAFAERAGLFGGAQSSGEAQSFGQARAPSDDVEEVDAEPEIIEVSRPPRAARTTTPAMTKSVVAAEPPPSATAPAASSAKATEPASSAPSAARQPDELSDKALRCLRKLNELLDQLEEQPRLFDDVDYCVDYLLVVARLRELPRPEKKLVVRTVGHEALIRYEEVEAQVRSALDAAPLAQPARVLAAEVLELLAQAPSPSRVPDSPFEEPLRLRIERFQEFSRAQKYLFMSRCGQQSFARFIDYFIAMGGAETA